MQLGVFRESSELESRVALTPETIKKLLKNGFQVKIERGAGLKAGLTDALYQAAGAQVVIAEDIAGSKIHVQVNPPSKEQINWINSGSTLISLVEPHTPELCIKPMAAKNVNVFSLEKVPRISRAQSMDVLSSQANIAGYRAVLEAAIQYPRFFPMMMTSAGMTKPAKVLVLGAGVAGLQAIATAKRLGAMVEAYDVRPEVKEQIQSLGAKPIELKLDEQGAGQGGYARELSEEGKKKQQEQLSEYLKKADIIVTTANIPGKRAPLLVPEAVVKAMRPGSVVIDMAAATGGNCAVTQMNQVISFHDVRVVGYTNYPSLVPESSSQFFGQNILNILMLLTQKADGGPKINWNFEDEIIKGSTVVFEGQVKL